MFGLNSISSLGLSASLVYTIMILLSSANKDTVINIQLRDIDNLTLTNQSLSYQIQECKNEIELFKKTESIKSVGNSLPIDVILDRMREYGEIRPPVYEYPLRRSD